MPKTPLLLDPDDPESRYWHIHGKRYDLSDYIAKHPGGQLPLELTQGRECTEMFESYHSLCTRPKHLLPTFEVTTPEGGCPHHKTPFDWSATPFYDDLRGRVLEYFDNGRRTYKTPTASWMLLWLWLVLFAVSAVGWFSGYWFSLLTLPLFYWLGGSNLMHTGGHYALSKRPWINRLASLFGGIHIAPATWHRQHNIGHHVYTNIDGLDPDLKHFQHADVPMPGFRLSPGQAWLPKYVWHRWAMALQSMMTTMGPSLLNTPEYLIDGKVAKTTPFLFHGWGEVVVHVLGRVLVAGLVFVVPFLLFSPAKAVAFALVPLGVHGLLFFAFSQVSHVNAGCVDPADGCEWAEHQVRTCHDYSTDSRLWSVLSIGLNNQVVHHLFPQIAPWHYPALAAIVESTCADHGIPYATSERWVDAFRALLSHVADLNQPTEA